MNQWPTQIEIDEKGEPVLVGTIDKAKSLTTWFDVKRFGAIGDGSEHPLSDKYATLADAQLDYSFATALTQELDWAGWQAAINTAEAAGGGVVYGSAGNYCIDTTLTNDADYVTIMGDGFSTRLYTRTGAAVSQLLLIKKVVTAPTTQIVGWRVHNIQLDGNKDGGTTKCYKCLRVNLTDKDVPAHGIIDHVWAHDSSDAAGTGEGGGIAIASTATALGAHYWQGVEIANCYTYDNGDTNGWGIGLNSNRGVTITNCHSWGNQSMGVTVYDSQDVVLTGCISYDNITNNLNVESSDRVVIDGCIATGQDNVTVGLGLKISNSVDVQAQNCHILHDADAATSAAVRIRTVDTVATQLDRAAKRVLLTNCQIYKQGTNGYAVWLDDKPADGSDDPTDIRIRGCEIRNEQTNHISYGIYGDANGIEISDNHIYGGIDLYAGGGTPEIVNNTFECEFDTLADVVNLNAYTDARMNGNLAICDTAAANTVRAVCRSADNMTYLEFNNNRVTGKVDYVLRGTSGKTIYPTARGNYIGNLTIDTAITSNAVWPPASGTWPTGSTVWCDLDSGGYQYWYTYNGTAWIKLGIPGQLTMRPSLVAGRITAAGGIPTPVVVGCHAGYSMPIWSSPANQYEELYFREYVAGRWDGASDITVSIICCLASAETAGEDFAFQLSWENTALTGTISTSTNDVTTQQELAASRDGQYAVYRLNFAIDWDYPTPDVTASDHLACRLRRVAATGAGVDEVDGEIIVLDCIITYTVNRVYKVS